MAKCKRTVRRNRKQKEIKVDDDNNNINKEEEKITRKIESK